MSPPNDTSHYRKQCNMCGHCGVAEADNTVNCVGMGGCRGRGTQRFCAILWKFELPVLSFKSAAGVTWPGRKLTHRPRWISRECSHLAFSSLCSSTGEFAFSRRGPSSIPSFCALVGVGVVKLSATFLMYVEYTPCYLFDRRGATEYRFILFSR